MDKLDIKHAYGSWVHSRTVESASEGAGLQLAIGGNFDAFGVIQSRMLSYYGLAPDGFLVDVGCGSGRTAIPLSRTHPGKYLGTDVVRELVDYARAHCNRPDWEFAVVDDFVIPAKDGSADMVCFFSVLTHLLHEQSYLYLEQAKRVLKPGGKIVFSFLEFRIACHWAVFESTIRDTRGSNTHPLNVFLDRDCIRSIADHLDMTLIDLQDGDVPFVPLDQPLVLDDGRELSGAGNLGQSICVLMKPK